MNYDPKQTRLLIVDDTLQNIQVLGTILREQGYQLNVAQDGQKALDMITKVVPDLILLDVMMPQMDGHEACRRLKADPTTAHIPIIFLTAKTETEDIVKGFELGAIDYVTKPFNSTELLKRVETHLELALLRRSLSEQVEEKTQQLLQAQKMESMGQLAAGIAHEVNTPMQYINNNSDFLQQAISELDDVLSKTTAVCTQASDGQVDADLLRAAQQALEEADLEYVQGEALKAIDKIQEGVRRVVEIVEGMRELAHPGNRKKSSANLNHLINSSTNVCRNEWKYVAELKLELDADLPAINCLPSEISQCIVNIVVNAGHAIADAGGDQGVITVSSRVVGEAIEVSISDTGGGIPAEVQPKIFEFLYTTKEFGRGTGQGLSLAQRVIRDHHGGEISFQTEAGKGTTFTMSLPLVQQEPDAE
ncbi:MAG: signal transduction histidine kinase [Candidatus Latescibacterota bacterium]|jgi:signal transduction histidine kinase